MRRFVLPGLGAAAGIAALYVLIMWFAVWRFEASTDDAYVQADIAAIAPKLAGYVATLHVTDNQRVKAGDVLLEIDTSDIKPKVDQAAALVESRKAAVSTAEARLLLQQSVIRQAVASVTSAEADALRTQKDIARYQQLARRGYVSSQRLEVARADSGKADAATDRARAALDAERSQIPVLKAAREQALADLKQAEAALALARTDLTNATLRAPFDGVVGNRTVQSGQYVRAGVQAMVIVPLPNVYVVANFKETQIRAMQVGQKAHVEIDGLPDSDLDGEVESFAPASGAVFSLLPPENATGNFTKIVQRIPVRIRLEGKAEQMAHLRAGMSVAVTVDLHAPADKQAQK